MRYKKKLGLVVGSLAVTLFASCGGGGGSDPTSDTDSTTTLQGQFVDSPVVGLDYETSSGLKGVTDTNGYFEYRDGDTVTFKVGNIVLGDAKGDSLVTPTSLFVDEIADPLRIQEKVKTVTALLLLGKSNTDDTRIVLSETFKNALKNINQINLEETDQLNVNVDIDGDGQSEDLQQEVDNKKQEAENHYQEILYNYLTQTLSGLNGKSFYFSTSPDVTCDLTYNGGTSFSFTCDNGDSDSPTISKMNGEVKIIEGNGSENTVVSADPDIGKICMFNYDERKQICMILKTSDPDNTEPETSPVSGNVVDIGYFLKDIESFWYAAGQTDTGEAHHIKIRKKFSRNGKNIEVSYQFNWGSPKPDGSFCMAPDDMFVPECYKPDDYIMFELTSDSYTETYQCEEEYSDGQRYWQETNRNLNVPIRLELGKTYDIGVGQLAIEQYIPDQPIPFLHEVGSSRTQYQVLRTKYIGSKESNYTWFVAGSSGYGTLLHTTTPEIDFNNYLQSEHDWMNQIDEFFLYVRTSDNKKAYMNYNVSVDSTFLNNVQNLIDSLPDPFVNVPAECTHFQNL
ncbi:hypothetical protein [Persephonella sp.]